MEKYRAGIYLRLSKEHSEENNSIEAQREITTNYAVKNGYKIVKEYADNGYSGILDSRPALDQMMIDISRGFINMVIVKDISRLTRNKNKTGWYTEIFFPVLIASATTFILLPRKACKYSICEFMVTAFLPVARAATPHAVSARPKINPPWTTP